MRIKDEHKIFSIREQAMEMIVKEGFDGLSMQKLARAAGVSPATIYIYFKNREDLLNQIYLTVQTTFSQIALKGFHAGLSFEEGLWLQWKNRLHFILDYPVQYKFYEQFRNSPLLEHNDAQMQEFKTSMKDFLKHAIQNGELKKMEPELFWSMAYGPFYSMIKFHLQEKSMMNKQFKMTEAKMKELFRMVMRSFQ